MCNPTEDSLIKYRMNVSIGLSRCSTQCMLFIGKVLTYAYLQNSRYLRNSIKTHLCQNLIHKK